MQLTKGQKDALRRKALEIINKKFFERKEKLEKSFVPAPEFTSFLKQCRKISKLRDEYYSALNGAGFQIGYSSSDISFNGIYFSISHNNTGTSFYDTVLNTIMSKEVNRKLNEMPALPTEWAIADKLELATLSKDFNLEEFLAEYENL